MNPCFYACRATVLIAILAVLAAVFPWPAVAGAMKIGKQAAPLLPPVSAQTLYPYGGAAVANAAVTGEPFKDAITLTQPAAAKNPWEAGASEGLMAKVAKGDKLVATLFIRAVSPASAGKIEFSFEEVGGKYTRSASKVIAVTKNWTKVAIPFSSVNSYTASQAHVVFHSGYMKQSVQIGGLTLMDSGK